jgi:hypothetical protein
VSEFEEGERVKVREGRGWKKGVVLAQTHGPATRIKFDDGTTLSISNRIIQKDR